MITVAIDAKPYIRPSFRACLGVAVVIKTDDYHKTYDATMRELCEKYPVKRKSKVLKSFDILSTIGQIDGRAFIEEFFENIKSSIDGLIIYNTLFDHTIQTINIYGKPGSFEKQVNISDFLNKLSNSYPHCCAWKYLQDYRDNKDSQIWLDYFEGETTYAWYDLKRRENVKIFYNGDQCNPYISTADLIAKLTDMRLYSKNLKINKKGILSAFPDFTIDSQYIGDIGMIRMINDTMINTAEKICHPIIYIIKEGVLIEEVIGTAKEHDIFKASPAMSKIKDLAHDKKGCFKFFDAGKDQQYIEKGDIFVYLGESGRKHAEYFKRIGHEIEILSIEQL